MSLRVTLGSMTPSPAATRRIDSTSRVSTTAPDAHTTTWLVRREPKTVAANSRSVSTMTVARDTP
jgi:hypothetical protein